MNDDISDASGSGWCGIQRFWWAIENHQSSIINHQFTHAHRLHGNRAFAAVFEAKVRKNAGPLLVFTRPNGLAHARLGLSVSRRVGNAVTRSRHKRLLREAFRLTHHDWPKLPGQEGAEGGGLGGGGLDLVIVVRPHELLHLTDYQRLLAGAMDAAQRTWAKR